MTRQCSNACMILTVSGCSGPTLPSQRWPRPSENFSLLRQQSSDVLNAEFVEDLLLPFEPLSDALSCLDNKDKSTNEPATREDVVAVLKAITGNTDLEECVREGLNVAGSLFMVCVHLLVPLTLMRNPKEYMEKAHRTPANQAFKEQPTPRRMRDFILNSITKKCRPVSGGSMWDLADEDKEQEQSQRGRRTARGREKPRRPLPSAWEEDNSSRDHSPEEEAVPQRRRWARSRNNKRCRRAAGLYPKVRIQKTEATRPTTASALVCVLL